MLWEQTNTWLHLSLLDRVLYLVREAHVRVLSDATHCSLDRSLDHKHLSDPIKVSSYLIISLSPRAHLLVVGMLRFLSDINQPSLPTPFFYSVLMSVFVFLALSTVFHSINSPNNSPFLTLFFRSYLCLTGPFNYIYLFIKVSFSPDIMPSG